ncbi:MAG: DsbA family protein [Alphaproteobacteria bacterium]|nr:MAG: DsbA family protein [Alphaproteobacteria bacterium]
MPKPLDKLISLTVLLGAAAALVMGFSRAPAPDMSTPAPATDTPASESVVDGYSDIVLGDPDAPITVIEYASMTCAHCAAFHEDVFHDFKKNYIDTGRAKFIMRHFVLNGPDLAASMVARCVDSNRYYAFIDLFLGRQAAWITPWQNVRPAEDSTLADLAEMAEMDIFLRPTGVSTARMRACLESKKLQDDLLRQRAEGQKQYDIKGTPTIIINGKVYTGEHTYEAFEAALKKVE